MTSYINLINNFWLLSEEYDFRPIDIALYFYLLRIANGLSWKPSFRRSNLEIMTKLGISTRHTFNDARNRLKIAGLIEYATYNGKPFSTYTVIDTCAKNAQVTAQVTAQVNKNKTKTKIKKENIKRKKDEAENLDLKFDEPKKTKSEKETPTIEEVVEICLSKGMTENEAKDFFYYYDAQGWVTSSGQQIKRLDSMVNRWLKNGKEKRNGNNNTDSEKREKRNREVIEDVMSRYS